MRSNLTKTLVEMSDIGQELLDLERRVQLPPAETAVASTIHLLGDLVEQVRSGVDGRGVRSVDGMVVGIGSTYLGHCNASYASFIEQIRGTRPAFVPWVVPVSPSAAPSCLDLRGVQDSNSLCALFLIYSAVYRLLIIN